MDIIQHEQELYNRSYVYLQLLERRLKKYEYLEKHNIIVPDNFSSSDNSYLLEQDYFEIKHSENYNIPGIMTKNVTIKLKQLLEENIHNDKIFCPYLEIKICPDQEIYESFEIIKLRYLGFKLHYNIYEDFGHSKYEIFDINKNYHNHIYCSDPNIISCLKLHHTTLFVFEVLDNNFDKKYIFFSNFSKRFYKTNEFIKLDYIPTINCDISMQIIMKRNIIHNIEYTFRFLNDRNNFFQFNYIGQLQDSYTNIMDTLDLLYNIDHDDYNNKLYTKVSCTKGIQK